MTRRLLAVLPVLLACSGPALADDALSIMQDSDRRMKAQDEQIDYRMELFEADHLTFTRQLTRLDKRMSDRTGTLVRFTAPAAVKNVALLIEDSGTATNDIWSYTPSTKNLRRLAGSQKQNWFMGTDFTYEDFEDYKLASYQFASLGKPEPCLSWPACRRIEARGADRRGAHLGLFAQGLLPRGEQPLPGADRLLRCPGCAGQAAQDRWPAGGGRLQPTDRPDHVQPGREQEHSDDRREGQHQPRHRRGQFHPARPAHRTLIRVPIMSTQPLETVVLELLATTLELDITELDIHLSIDELGLDSLDVLKLDVRHREALPGQPVQLQPHRHQLGSTPDRDPLRTVGRPAGRFMNEVVITGVGCVSPFGIGRQALWGGLTEARCAIGRVPWLPGNCNAGALPEQALEGCFSAPTNC